MKTEKVAASPFLLNLGSHTLGRLMMANPKIFGKAFRQTSTGKLLTSIGKRWSREAFKAGFEGKKIRELPQAVGGTLFPGAMASANVMHAAGKSSRAFARPGETLPQTARRIRTTYERLGTKARRFVGGMKTIRAGAVPAGLATGATAGLLTNEVMPGDSNAKSAITAATIGAILGGGVGYGVRGASTKLIQGALKAESKSKKYLRESRKFLQYLEDPKDEASFVSALIKPFFK